MNINNQAMGAIKINTPSKHVNRGFECAAWWEETETKPGIYSLFLGYQEPYRKDSDLMLFAKAEAVVTNDYFPALFGGVNVSSEPYKPKHIGERRERRLGFDPIEAIQRTGQTPDGDISYYVNPALWHEFLKDSERRLQRAYESLPKWWNEYVAGDDEFHSRVGMVGHFGGLLRKHSKQIQTIKRQMEMYGLSGTPKSNMFIKLYNKNTVWAREFLKLPELPERS